MDQPPVQLGSGAGHPGGLANRRRRAPGRENARDRVLEPEELVAVWQASEALQPPFRQVVQLLAVTAARKGEVVTMRWQDLDLERRLWTVPAT